MPNIIYPVSALTVFGSSTTAQYALGTKGEGSDGTIYRYALAGGTALVAGNALQHSAVVANHQATTAAAAAIGAESITMTLGATAATANQYAEGYAFVYVTPGNGIRYRISSHPAADASAALTVKLYADEKVQVALTTASKISLVANPYKGVIQTPVTTLTGAVVGGAPFAIPASEYGWIQRSGPFAGLVDGTPAVGQILSCPAAVAGGFAINSSTLQAVAVAMVVGVDTKNQQIILTLE